MNWIVKNINGFLRMKIRFFGSPTCEDCLQFYVLLSKYEIDYEYINALDEDELIQAFCDLHEVDELPHIQFLSDKGNIYLQHTGFISEELFRRYLAIFDEE